jgi:O-antigen biosynthesis protein
MLDFNYTAQSFRVLARSLYYRLPIPIKIKRSLLRKSLGLRTHFKRARPTEFPQPPSSSKDQLEILKRLCFQTSDQPLISILIPCYEQFSHTLHCLNSLQASPPSFPYEVIVVDDASASNDYAALESITGLRLVRNTTNRGFIKSCNYAATLAKGRYIYFLNNDTLVLAGTIDELVKTFDFFPQTGLVGSRLIYPDGQLQEAGGIVWKDGSAGNVGRFDSPYAPAYSHLRIVDYCSGASVMVPRKLFLGEGGFNTAYAPAYYEDTDFAMRLKAKGYAIHYQPLSTLVHYEGISHGSNENAGLKRHQISNQSTFFKNWHIRLAKHHPWGTQIQDAMARGIHGRVLLVDNSIPRPDRDAGSICVLNLMLLLRGMGFQPSFFPDNLNIVEERYKSMCEGLGIEVLSAPYIKSLKKHLSSVGNRYDLVVLFRPDLTHERLPLIRRLCKKARIIYYPHDLHYWRFEREGAVKNQPALLNRALTYRRVELANSRKSDTTIVLSIDERQELQTAIPEASVELLPLVFKESATVKGVSRRNLRTENLIFIGSFNHSPNEDAMLFFCNDVLPLLLKDHPSVIVNIVGGSPTQAIQALAGPHVKVRGFIEDLDRFLDDMMISIVPLRYGAGVKGKIASAMRAALPVVSSSIGVEGIPIVDGKHVIVADSAESQAKAIGMLLADPDLRLQLGEAGCQFMNQNWGEQASFLALGKILKKLGLNPSPVPLQQPLPLFPFTQQRWPGEGIER